MILSLVTPDGIRLGYFKTNYVENS